MVILELPSRPIKKDTLNLVSSTNKNSNVSVDPCGNKLYLTLMISPLYVFCIDVHKREYEVVFSFPIKAEAAFDKTLIDIILF